MNWAWATSLDQTGHSPAFPMWMTLAAAGFFGLILLIALDRARRRCDRRDEPDAGNEGAAQVARARSLRPCGAGAGRSRRLYPVRMRRLPLADRSAAGRLQHGYPSLREAGRALCAKLERAR